MVARRVHTPEAVGSNPTSATIKPHIRGESLKSKDDKKLAKDGLRDMQNVEQVSTPE